MRDDVHGIDCVAGEVDRDGLGETAGLEVGGQQVGAAVLEVDAEERCPGGEEQRAEPDRDERGPALGGSGEAGEEAVVGDALGGHLDAAVEGGEQGRDEGETGGESDQDDSDAGGAERAEDGELEDEQAAERDRHGEGGERDGAPCGRDGDHHRLLGVAAETAFLAIALHHEQGVVDRQAQAEHGRHGWHARVERQEVGEGEQRGEAAGDRAERAQERYARSDEPAEQEHHHEQRDRHGNGFAALGVLLGLLGALAFQEKVAAEDHLGASVLAQGAEAFLYRVQRLVFTVGPEVLEVDEEQHGLAVGGDEARFGRGGHGVDHAGDAGDLAQVGGRGCQGVVVAVALDDGGDARAVLRCVGHDVEALKRLDLACRSSRCSDEGRPGTPTPSPTTNATSQPTRTSRRWWKQKRPSEASTGSLCRRAAVGDWRR